VPAHHWASISELSQIEEGDLIYLDFWASWCTPCRKSFPWLNEMQSKYGSQGFKVIAVNLDSDKSLAKRFLSAVPADFPIYYDPQSELAEALELKGMPSSYLLDSNGSILAQHVGFKNKKTVEYEVKIQSFLKN
jgi:thiol-disulfide isomerase/thioredoxin